MPKFKIVGYISTIFGFVFLVTALLGAYGYGALSSVLPLMIFGLGAIACGVTLLSVRYGETKKLTDFIKAEKQTATVKQDEKTNQEIKVVYDLTATQKSVEQEDKTSYDFSTNGTLPTKQEENSNEFSEPQMTMYHQTKTPNKSFSYMLFFLGALLRVVGLFLVTYTTVVMVNKPVSILGYTYYVPTAEQISPYQSIGFFVILGSIVSIGYALYTIKEQTQ